MKYIISTVISFLLLSSASAQQLKQLADSILQTGDMAEIGYAVIKPASITDIQVFGYHRIDLKDSSTLGGIGDYFHLGSNTKAITGLIAAYLIEHNKLKWDTKFFDLFPSWKLESDSAYYNISLEDLLSHRARIQPYTSGLEFQKLPKYTGTKSEQRKEFAKHLLTQKPVISNQVYNYSNAGYSIAALMLEQVSGKTWEELVQQIVSGQLHLKYIFGWPNKFNSNEPWGHLMVKDTLRALPPDYDYKLNLIEPAGDISMPLPDYAKLIQLHLQGLSGMNNIISSDSYKFLHYGLKDYAIGWANTESGGIQTSRHAGSAGTFFTYTIINKTKKVAYIVLSNCATNKAQKDLVMLIDRMMLIYP